MSRRDCARGCKSGHLALWLAFIALLGCSGGNDEDGAIRIAVEGPLTGEQASNGLDMLRGVQLAVHEVNENGGVLRRHIELIEADDRADPELAEPVARAVYEQGPSPSSAPITPASG